MADFIRTGVKVADDTVEDSPVIPEVPSTNYALQVNTECEAFVAVPNTNVAQLTSTQSGATNADPNLTVTEGAQVSNVQVTGGTDISVTRNSDTEITIASTATGAIDYLIKAVTHSTTITTTTVSNVSDYFSTPGFSFLTIISGSLLAIAIIHRKKDI